MISLVYLFIETTPPGSSKVHPSQRAREDRKGSDKIKNK
jgi:hypothetical protein